jgi:CS domain
MSPKCQFHQQGNFIHVLIKAAGVRDEDLNVQIQRRRLTVNLNKQCIVEGLLHGQVDVGNSKVKIHPDHVEIKLRKADPNETWPQLMLGVPDMMTSLQRAQNQGPAPVSPDNSPTRPVVDTNKLMNTSKLNASISNMVHNVFKGVEDDMREMRDTSLSRASQRGQ